MSRRIVLSLIGAAAALGSGGVSAAPVNSDAPTPIVLPLEGVRTNPDWLAKPNGDDLEREYPTLAVIMQIGGGATMTCVARPNGRLDGCKIANEYPAGLGFGNAALRSSKYFLMKPAKLDGVAVTSEVTVPMRFQTQVSEVPASPTTGQGPTSPAALATARRVVALESMKSAGLVDVDHLMQALNNEVSTSTSPAKTLAALDALRQGWTEELDGLAEQRAAREAALLTEPQLAEVARFLGSPAGRAWQAASNGATAVDRPALLLRIAARARARFCASNSCGPAAAPAPPPRPKAG